MGYLLLLLLLLEIIPSFLFDLLSDAVASDAAGAVDSHGVSREDCKPLFDDVQAEDPSLLWTVDWADDIMA